jgi:hypothetical protein
VASFPNDFYIHPADLEKARGGTECLVHPGQDLDLFCADCQMVICIKCLMTKHKPHTTKDLHEAADEARKQLAEDAKRLEKAVDVMITEVEADRREQRAVDDKKTVLEAQIHARHHMVTDLADKLRDEQLAALNDTCNVMQQEVSRQTGLKKNKLDQLLQLQQQVQQAVSSGKASQLLSVAKEMRKRRGSADAVTNLKMHFDRYYYPASTLNVNFALGDDAFKELLLEALKATVIEQGTLPQVAVKQQFHVGPETDIRVFNLSPKDNNEVWVSYELRGGKEDVLGDCFNWSGKFLRHDNRKFLAGKSTGQARGNGKGILEKYKDENWTYTLSKSQHKTPIRLGYTCSALQGKGYVEKVVVLSEKPYKEEPKTLCTLAMPSPQRAFDVDASRRYIAVLQETPRNIHLYTFGQKSVATYTPPSPRCRPSDVCFFKLGEEEVLVVADEGTDFIHVLRVKDAALTFLGYLAPGCPLLVQPTALNTDHTGQLWVACKGGIILTIRPLTQRAQTLSKKVITNIALTWLTMKMHPSGFPL